MHRIRLPRFPFAIAAALLLAGCDGDDDSGRTAQQQPGPIETLSFTEVDSAFGQLPAGRAWGSASAIHPGPDGSTLWVADRCGENTCVGRTETDPIFQFDLDGRLLRSFGAGQLAFPHSLFVDHEGNVWLADASRPDAEGMGHVILKFSSEGELLMTLGRPGVAGQAEDTFDQPAAVLVAPNGDIFVADGHGTEGNNRIVKFAADGRYLAEWGETGEADGQFLEPHALAMDSRGRLFVADRGNSRIQIFDQEGNHLESWRQFSRPSGLFIDADDILYSADSSSNANQNPGWQRGIYIGSASSGEVVTFIPDPEPDPDNNPVSGAYGLATDGRGNLYAAEVGPRTVRRYAPE